LLAQHPLAAPRGRAALFERAERIGGQDGSWILYRIATADGMPAKADGMPAGVLTS
jgi:hypothetical protein